MKRHLGASLCISLVAVMVIGSLAALAAEPSLGQSHFAAFGTNKVHYVMAGSGTRPVVLLHGWSGDVDWWRYQLPALDPHAKIVLIDLPGHGQSDKPQVPYTMEFLAQSVDAVLRDTKIDKAVLVGFSLGAPIMCRFYRDHPEKVQALVAVDGALRGFNMSEEQREKFLGPFRGADYKESATKFLNSMFPNPGTEEMRDRVRERSLQTPQHVLLSSLEKSLDNAAWEPTKIDVPLLVINAKSPFWTADYEEHVRKLRPGVEYNTIEGTGHFVMMEKPKEVNRLLLAFLEKNGANASSGAKVATADWQSLFNGKDLAGWRQYGKQTPPGPGWKVEDGILKKLAKQRGGDIITTSKFDDFEFYWEWRLEPKANNGIKYLVTEQRPGAPGHEYQMIDEEGGEDIGRQTHLTASFYEVLPPDVKKPLKKAGEWNSSRVLIKGNHVEHWLNGAKVLAYELGSDEVKAGVARSKFKNAAKFGEKIQGHIMLTDHGDEAWFRNLKIRELK